MIWIRALRIFSLVFAGVKMKNVDETLVIVGRERFVAISEDKRYRKIPCNNKNEVENMLKENNGRAAARRWRIRTIVLTMMIAVGTIVFVSLRVHQPSLMQKQQSKVVSSTHQRSLIHHHHNHDGAATKQKVPRRVREAASKQELQRILNAEVHLIELTIMHEELLKHMNTHQFDNENDGDQEESKDHLPSYDGIYGSFCTLEWSLHKKDPSSYPMFRDLVDNSKGCEKRHRITDVNIRDLVKLAREVDASDDTDTRVLDLSAVVFHESRCGSTLTANIFAAVDPAAHRVYSESSPPLQVLNQVCGEDLSMCDTKVAASVLRDVMYLMRRSNDPNEARAFFKIQSVGTRNLSVFTTAFPKTPYLMVYREPVQVMMSHLKGNIRNANCVRQRRSPPAAVVKAVKKYTPGISAKNIPAEDYCAAHLASITETMVKSHTANGIPINYESLPDLLYSEILPFLLNVPSLTDTQLRTVKEVAAVYSKNRGGNRVAGSFQSDSEAKEEMASPAVRHASQTYLLPSFVKLEKMAETARERVATLQEMKDFNSVKRSE
jgi:hypothetical protein